jgi:hypothetical protein
MGASKMSSGVVVSTILLARDACLALGQRVDGFDVALNADSSRVTADKLLDGALMLGVDVSAKLMVTSEAIGMLSALGAVDLGMLRSLVVALVDRKLGLLVGSGNSFSLGHLLLGLRGELDSLA